MARYCVVGVEHGIGLWDFDQALPIGNAQELDDDAIEFEAHHLISLFAHDLRAKIARLSRGNFASCSRFLMSIYDPSARQPSSPWGALPARTRLQRNTDDPTRLVDFRRLRSCSKCALECCEIRGRQV
jgi:hypothetical protein